MKLIYNARLTLIRGGKIFPFVLCFIAMLTYAETAFACALSDFAGYGGYVVPCKPLAWLIGRYFEYNAQMLMAIVVVSVSVKTCIYNKMACCYLAINLLEKSMFTFEMELSTIYVVCAANVVAAGYLTYKGVKIILFN